MTHSIPIGSTTSLPGSKFQVGTAASFFLLSCTSFKRRGSLKHPAIPCPQAPSSKVYDFMTGLFEDLN